MFHVKQFEQFYHDLIEKNKVMNLTTIEDEKMFHVKHLEDSLALNQAVPDLGETPYTMIDIGTGAGFPGMPLAIEYENLKVTMFDSLGKRIDFINEEIKNLGLKNAEAIHARAEDLAHDDLYREKFDIAVSRAVANLSTLSEYAIPFIHKGGHFYAYKSGDISEEVEKAEKAIDILGGKIENIVRFELSEGMGERTIIDIKKVRETPKKFPRKAGTPSRKPIGES